MTRLIAVLVFLSVGALAVLAVDTPPSPLAFMGEDALLPPGTYLLKVRASQLPGPAWPIPGTNLAFGYATFTAATQVKGLAWLVDPASQVAPDLVMPTLGRDDWYPIMQIQQGSSVSCVAVDVVNNRQAPALMWTNGGHKGLVGWSPSPSEPLVVSGWAPAGSELGLWGDGSSAWWCLVEALPTATPTSTPTSTPSGVIPTSTSTSTPTVIPTTQGWNTPTTGFMDTPTPSFGIVIQPMVVETGIPKG